MQAVNLKRAVFLDRDGTLIEEKHYLHRPEEVVLLEGAAAACRRLQAAGFLLVLVTNQSGVGRGYFSLAEVDRVHARLEELLGREGVTLARIYVAPESPDQPSLGRKPSPYFLREAARELGLELKASYMVGDKRADVECGGQAGVRASLLVRTGYGSETEREGGWEGAGGRPVVVEDLAAAAEWILKEDQQT